MIKAMHKARLSLNWSREMLHVKEDKQKILGTTKNMKDVCVDQG